MNVKLYEKIVEAATRIHTDHTSEVEVDGAPTVSVGDDGTWVSGWLFVPNDAIEE